MQTRRSASPDAAADRFPPQIKFIIGNEACERFSYYGIRSILALYISTELFRHLPAGQARDTATAIIHTFIFANYFTPLLGAWLSDKFWGRYHTILWVSLVYCLGNAVLALGVGSLWGLYLGLALVALGSGGIKPCVSAFCGDQFRPEQSGLLQKAYGLFYWSINFGSFFSFLVIPWVKDAAGYRWAFGVPGLLMLLATAILWLGRKGYTRVPPTRETKQAGFVRVLWSAVADPPAEVPASAAAVIRRPGKLLAASGLVGIGLLVVGLFALLLRHWSDLQQFLVALAVWGGVLLLELLVVSVALRFKRTQSLGLVRAGSAAVAVWGMVSVALALGGGAAGASFLAGKAAAQELTWGLVANAILGGLGLLLTAAKGAAALWGGVGACAAVGRLEAGSAESGRAVRGKGFWADARGRFTEREVEAARSVGPILAVFAPITIFWALFDQTTSTWVMQGSEMTAVPVVGKFVIGAEQMQSMNPALVMLLVPSALWLYPRIQRVFGVRVTPLRRMGTGMFLAGLSYIIVGFIQTQVDAGVKLSVLWQTLPYFILTTAEVLVSTTGLEFAFTQAAPEMKSTIMSFWLLTVAVGNLFVPLITKLKGSIIAEPAGAVGGQAVSASTFHLYAGLTLLVALVFVAIAVCYRERQFQGGPAGAGTTAKDSARYN